MKKIKIYIILVLIIGVLIGGLFVWQNHQKTIERKYQACLEKCKFDAPPGFSSFSKEYMFCATGCKEKYAK